MHKDQYLNKWIYQDKEFHSSQIKGNFGFIYELHIPAGNAVKKYIGQKIFDKSNLWMNYYGSGKLVKARLNRIDRSNVERHILKLCKSRKELNDTEILFIEKFNAIESSEYLNLASIKSGNDLSEEAKRKISEANKISLKGNKNASGKRYKGFGRKMSKILTQLYIDNPELRQSASRPHTEKTKRKISMAIKGRKHSEESKKKMRKSIERRRKDGSLQRSSKPVFYRLSRKKIRCDSITILGKEFGLGFSAASNWLTGRSDGYKNYGIKEVGYL